MRTGQRELFDFGNDFYVGEPIFVPRSGQHYRGNEVQEVGWLLSQVFDLKAQTSFFALFTADNLADGPIARLVLTHHVPISFHGYWRERGTV